MVDLSRILCDVQINKYSWWVVAKLGSHQGPSPTCGASPCNRQLMAQSKWRSSSKAPVPPRLHQFSLPHCPRANWIHPLFMAIFVFSTPPYWFRLYQRLLTTKALSTLASRRNRATTEKRRRFCLARRFFSTRPNGCWKRRSQVIFWKGCGGQLRRFRNQAKELGTLILFYEMRKVVRSCRIARLTETSVTLEKGSGASTDSTHCSIFVKKFQVAFLKSFWMRNYSVQRFLYALHRIEILCERS